MSLTLKRHEGVPAALQRVSGRRLDHVLRLLERAPHAGVASDIHAARRQIKQLRALLRLTDHDRTKKESRRADRRLRDAARRLSPLRDATVLLATLQGLHRRGSLTSGALTALQSAVQLRQQRAYDQLVSTHGRRKALTASLADTRQQIAHWSPGHRGWKAMSRGLRRIYRAGRAAAAASVSDASNETLHETRKRTKDLLYALEFLHRIQPRSMRARIEAARRLTDCLGEDHDLAMFENALRVRLRSQLEPAELMRVKSAVALRRGALQRGARALARALYEPTEEVFVTTIHRYWKKWRVDARGGPARRT